MSPFLQFNCPTQNEIVRKAMETYIGFLEQAFVQHWNLWEDYTKLQENHKLCNISLSQVTSNKLCAEMKDELTPQRQLNDGSIVRETEGISMLELESLDINATNCDRISDMESNSAHLIESLHKSTDKDSRSKSPIFPRKYLRVRNTTAKKFIQLPAATSVCSNLKSDTKVHHNIEKDPPACNTKLQISTTHHVETTFLPDGKKLKQSRLIFRPIKSDEKNVLLTDTDKLKFVNEIQKAEQNSIVNISMEKPITTARDNGTEIDDTFSEDIEISPSQRNFKPNIMRCLKRLKRKNVAGQTVKSSLDKNEHNLNDATDITIDTIDLTPCSSSKYTCTKVESNKFSVTNNTTFDALKDKINIKNWSPTRSNNGVNAKIIKFSDKQKKDQPMTNKTESIAQNASDFQSIRESAKTTNCDENETFNSPMEKLTKKTDMDDFDLNVENEIPSKRALLHKSDVSLKSKINIPEQLNMRSKVDRAKLNGWDCWECEEYYKHLSLPKKELQKRKNQCSRHRYKYKRPNTPEGFWDPEFPETMSSTLRQHMN